MLGRHPAEMNAIAFSETPADIRRPAPKLGEHTRHVLCDLLGMASAEYAALEEKGVLT